MKFKDKFAEFGGKQTHTHTEGARNEWLGRFGGKSEMKRNEVGNKREESVKNGQREKGQENGLKLNLLLMKVQLPRRT